MRALAVTLVALFGLLAGGCGSSDREPSGRPPEAFCRAAARYENRLVRRADIDEQVRLVRRMAETAPAEIAPDVRTFLDALEAVRDDPDVRGDPDVEEAVNNVNRYATSGCHLLEQDDGGGGSPF